MRGDCSIRIGARGFSAEEITACAAAKGLLSLELELEESGRCRCEVCRAAGKDAALSVGEIENLLGQARELGCRRCILVDDAGAWRRGLEEAMEAAGEMEVELFCGAALTPAAAAWLAHRKAGVSLLGSGSVCGSGREKLRAAVEHLKRAGFGRAGMPGVSVRALLTDGTRDELLALWRWCRTEGIEPRFQVFMPGRAEEGLAGGPEGAKAFYHELSRVDRVEFGREWSMPAELTGRSCNRHLYACHITACGTVYACVGVTIPLGNVRQGTLAGILDAEVLENLRDFHGHVKEPCNTCSQTTDCYGCRGAAYQATGDYLAGDAGCWKAAGVAIATLPIGVGPLIPHGPSMRVVDKLVRIGNKMMEASYTVAQGSPLVDAAGVLDDTAYVEMIAQTFAATQAFHPRPGDFQTREGYLLGIKNLVVAGRAKVGEVLKIAVRKSVRFGDFCFVEGMISRADGTIVAHGEVKLYRPASAANAGD